MKQFVHLHNHSEFSLLDGIASVKKIAARVKELGMPAFALTDHGVMYGTIPFYLEMKEAQVKPIIGCEVYVARRRMSDRDSQIDRDRYHLTLLAKNITGYRNLMKLVSIAHCDGMFYKPRVDLEALSGHAEGLICLSGCLNGPISRSFLNDGTREADLVLEKYASIFGKNYYIELQKHGIADEDLAREYLLNAASRKGIPIVATNDCHYIHKEDARAHDIALCMNTKKGVEDEERMRYAEHEYFIKTYAEMYELFSDVPDALDATLEIADLIDLELPLNKVTFPNFEIPIERTEVTHAELLQSLVFEGAERRYGNPLPQIYKERLNYELGVINETGYETYFLIVWDFIRFARSKGISVGPGRGSGAGSCVAYCLEITDVDPIRFNLIFERFLNKDRVSMPDFDIDFCMNRREEVIAYVKEKYGADNVAQIVTFNHLKTKAVIKAVGRVMNLPFQYVNEVTKKVPFGLDMTIETAIKDSPDLVKMMNEDEKVNILVNDAIKLEGLVSHGGVHAAGIVIAKGCLEDFVPVQKSSDTEMRVAQYDLSVIEKAGLVKMDFLGLRTLTMLQEAVKLVYELEGVYVDLRNMPYEDEMTFKLFQRGDTVGVFQFEREFVRRVLREAQPTTLEDLSTINGLNRPGPMASSPQYIENRRNPDHAVFAIPELRDVLEETNGIVIYQEQVMLACRKLAGFTMGQADVMRAAMGKKKIDTMAEMKIKFLAGCVENGYTEEQAEEWFSMIETFAGYGFNKCHSLPYSILSYQTGYFRAHYPRHFITAVINSYLGDAKTTKKYIAEARRMGFAVYPPDVNSSVFEFRPESNGIRFGLAGIKGIGKASIQAILAAREDGEFKTVSDFIQRIDSRAVTKGVLEALIKAGAFGSLDTDKSKLLENIGRLSDRSRDPRQAGLFGEFVPEPDLPEVFSSRYTREELAELEHEVLGVYLTGHPLEDAPVLNDPDLMTPTRFYEWLTDSMHLIAQNRQIELGGVLQNIEFLISKNGNQYARAKLIDTENSIALLIFEKKLKELRNMLVSGNHVRINGNVEIESSDLDEDNESERDFSSMNVFVNSMSIYETDNYANNVHTYTDDSDERFDDIEDFGIHSLTPTKDEIVFTTITFEFTPQTLRNIDVHQLVRELRQEKGNCKVVFLVTFDGKSKALAIDNEIRISLEKARLIARVNKLKMLES